MKYGSIFKREPEQKFSPYYEDGIYRVDLLPFITSKDFRPFNGYKADDICYFFCLDVHNIGESFNKYVCPKKTFNEYCPVCEYIQKNRELTKTLYRKLIPKVRNVFLLWERSDPFLKVWEVADFYIGRNIRELWSRYDRMSWDDYLYSMFDIEEGKTFKFTKSGSGLNTKYFDCEFIQRDEPLPYKIFEDVYPVDLLIDFDPNKLKMSFDLDYEERLDSRDEEGREILPSLKVDNKIISNNSKIISNNGTSNGTFQLSGTVEEYIPFNRTSNKTESECKKKKIKVERMIDF